MKIVIPVALLLILIVPLQVAAHHGPPDSAILYDVSEILEYEVRLLKSYGVTLTSGSA